jgi:uncharacterized protein YxjI
MPIPVNCQCGMSYTLRDQFQGQILKCRQCGTSMKVGAPGNGKSGVQSTPVAKSPAPPNVTLNQAMSNQRNSIPDEAFSRDRFLLNQRVLAISEKYDVCDDEGNPILYIERPRHSLLNLLAAIIAMIVAIVVFSVGLLITSGLPTSLSGLMMILTVVGTFAVSFLVGILLSKKRHITIYRDKTKQEPLLKVLQDKKFEWFTATFTVRDAKNGDLARLRKNYFYDIFRKRWECYRPDGSLFCIAKEDSIELAILRRFLGTFYGLLRTNFIIVKDDSNYLLGQFDRKFTLFDRYVLDMSADSSQTLDRRIALALGVILDTGERR